MEEDMWHQPEDTRSLSSRVDTQSLGSRSNLGVRGRRQPHQSPHHSLSRAFGEHVRRAYNRYEQDQQHSEGEIRHRGRRRHDSDERPSRERRYERRQRRPGEEVDYPRRRHRHRRHRHEDGHRRDRSRDRHYRERDRSDFEHNFNARMQRWMNGTNEPMYGGY